MAAMLKAAQYIPQSPEERVEGFSLLLPLPARNGFVFLLAKTRKPSADAELVFQLLSDQMHRLAESFDAGDSPQHRFEQFLGSLNEILANAVREGKWRLPIQELDALVGIACDEQMFLSGTGDLCALFLHRKQQRYQVFNLFRSIQTEQSLPTWEKAFAVVLDGDLHEGDVFVLSNQDLQRAVPVDDLNTILTTLPPTGSTEKLRQYFSARTGMLLLVICMAESFEPAFVQETRSTLKTDVSINQFKEQEDLTQQLLEDQTPQLGSLVRFLQTRWKRLLEQKIWPLLWSQLRRLGWNTLKAMNHLKTKEGRTETTRRLMGTLTTTQKRGKNLLYTLTHLPKTTRYLSLGIVAIVIVLSVSVSFLSSSRAQAEEQKAYTEKVAKIEDLMERAAGAVIYKDENQARSLFISAAALIDQLPTTTPERVEQINSLKTDIQKATDEIRHLVNVPNPALLGDLASLTDGVFGQALVAFEKDLFVFTSDGRIYAHDRLQKIFKPASTQIDGSRVAVVASTDDNHAYALMTDGSLVEYTKGESSQIPIAFTKPEGTLQDVIAYANRLYLLSTTDTDGFVYRFSRSTDGFGTGSSWITSKTIKLNNARAISIDGSIYVLEKNGAISRFESGSEVGFDLGVVDPPLTNATDLWTDADSNYLYVLEPDTKRVVVFEKKSGAFIVQYRSDAFQNLTDLVVDEQGYSIYLLSGSKLYSIAPSHIAQ